MKYYLIFSLRVLSTSQRFYTGRLKKYMGPNLLSTLHLYDYILRFFNKSGYKTGNKK